MFDLNSILLTIALVANLLLGVMVWKGNPRNRLNIVFGLFSLVTICWIGANLLFFVYVPTIFVIRVVFALGVLVLPLALVWAGLLIEERLSLSTKIVLGVTAAYAFLATTFSDDVVGSLIRSDTEPFYSYVAGDFYNVYVAYHSILFVFMLYLLARHLKRADKQSRAQRVLVLIGTLLYGLVTFITSIAAPTIHATSVLYSYDAQSSLFLVIFAAYAILKYNLFNVKVIATELFAVSIWTVAFIRLLLAPTLNNALMELLYLAGTILFGALLVKSVKKEVEIREKGERLARYLANANARLRELDKQKTEFVSIASHQLRGPIAAIVGYTSLMFDGSYGKVPEHLDEPLSRVFESGKRISIMVDDFLNVTRIEQGRMAYSLQPTELVEMVHKAVNELSVIGEKNGLKVSFNSNKLENVMVNADPSKLAQVFQNLIDNAIKYTPEGSVTISMRLSESGSRVLVSVTDTGIGIAPHELHNLFQKFNRASNANTVSVYGAGLGLYIAKEIVKAHEGWIHITSPGIGKGTTFTVELPKLEEDETARTT